MVERKERTRKRQTQILCSHSRFDLYVVYGLQRGIFQLVHLHHQGTQPFGRYRVDHLGRIYGYKRNRIYPRRIYGGKDR